MRPGVASVFAGRELLTQRRRHEIRQRGAQAIDHPLEHDGLDLARGGVQ